jgi:16S rRNA (adenine1518-N6/adenine1519-N6)-dimethyltransferase
MPQKLGQHFLHSDSALNEIITASELSDNDIVLEIGPGKGALTKKLLAVSKKVLAVEKDTELISFLKKMFSEEISSGKLVLIEDDIRNFKHTDVPMLSGTYKLIANIPYYITGEILRTFIAGNNQPSIAVLLMQKEVAERITTKHGKESILSISIKAYGNPTYIKTIKRGSFNPPPDIDSAILKIENISKNQFDVIDEEFFFKIVKSGFAHKRKQLAGNLSVYGRTSVEKILVDLGYKTSVRAEELSVNNWVTLCEKLKEMNL